MLVAGGGIVGAGVARDAAMRGLRVGLVEQHDLAFGTSSRSTRLLHGGLRYLAQGHIGLVYQSSHEKKIVHRIAPHISQPLPIIFPTYRLTQWPFWKLRIGVKIYDLLCGGRNLGPSFGMSPGETLAKVPGLNPYDLTGAVRYFDSQSNDARLVIDTLRSAAGHGAIVANYLRLETAIAGKNRWECQLRDTFADRTHRVFARTVVNACGPWSATLPNSSVRLRLTKGVHLVIDRQRLNVPDAVMVTKGERTLFVIPWGERGILGSTDTDYDGPLDDVHTEPRRRSIRARCDKSLFSGGQNHAVGHSQHLGRIASAYRLGTQRLALGYFPVASNPHAQTGMDRRGRRKTDHIPADRRASGGSHCPTFGRENATLQNGGGTFE